MGYSKVWSAGNNKRGEASLNVPIMRERCVAAPNGLFPTGKSAKVVKNRH